MPAAHFLFAALQVVSDCRTSRRQAPVCRTQSDRGQKEMYRVRHVLCIYFKQRQILPGLPEADYPQTGSRAHEEKTRSCYAVGAKKALFYAALTAVLKGGNILIPIPLKSRFYCVTKNNLHPWARWPTYRLPRPFFFCVHLSALCSLCPFWLTFHFQNTVDILLDNVVFLDLLFQLPIVGIQGFFLLLKCCVLCLQGGKTW